jgi:hypothetical protein
VSGRVEGAWSPWFTSLRRGARGPEGVSDIAESIDPIGCNEMAARLRNGRSRAWPFPTCGVGGTASHSEAADSIPSGANGGTDAAPFAAPVGRGEAEGALGVPDGGVTEARYWSAPSFVIRVT